MSNSVFLVKESLHFVPRMGMLEDDTKQWFTWLMEHMYACLQENLQNRLGPNGELHFDWRWPITIKVDINRDGKHMKFVAEVSAEGEWQ